MDCFSYNDIQNLAKLVGADKESNEDLGNMNYYNNSLTGSVLTPNTIANPTNKKNDKELARPYTKIEAKYNNRLTNNNNDNNNNKDKNTDKVHKSEYSDKNINSQIKKENNIWDIDELDNNEKIIEDGRVKPELDIMYRQVVGAEDVYLGMNGVENSSTACSMLSIKIHLPKTHLKEITFEVKNQSIHLNVMFNN